MHKKDYRVWHDYKTKINNDKIRPNFHEREIWFCVLGENIGFEQDGKGHLYLRPVLVLKKFNNDILWGIPLSKSHNNIRKKSSVFYYQFNFIKDKESVAILSQLRLIDGKRLARKIGSISESDFRLLIEKLKALLP